MLTEVFNFSSLRYRHGVFAKVPLGFPCRILSSCVPRNIYFVSWDSTASLYHPVDNGNIIFARNSTLE